MKLNMRKRSWGSIQLNIKKLFNFQQRLYSSGLGFNGVVIDLGHDFETRPNWQNLFKISTKYVSMSQILRHCCRFTTPLNQNPAVEEQTTLLKCLWKVSWYSIELRPGKTRKKMSSTFPRNSSFRFCRILPSSSVNLLTPIIRLLQMEGQGGQFNWLVRLPAIFI